MYVTKLGRFHWDWGLYFNNIPVSNGSAEWYYEEDSEYYCCYREDGEDAIYVLTFVKKDLVEDF